MTLGPRWWAILAVWVLILLSALLVPSAVHAAEGDVTVRQEYVRVTRYAERGVMADGNFVHDGVAACSMWMPFGTVLELPDGRVVVCEDRGHGDWYWRGWVDVWTSDNVTAIYGDYAWVSVRRWGWEN